MAGSDRCNRVVKTMYSDRENEFDGGHLDGEPHAPDTEEREDVDDGFSAGWGFHMQPSVRYWIDCHTHVRETRNLDALKAVARWHDIMWAYRLRRSAGVDGFPDRHHAFAKLAGNDDRFVWYCRLPWDEPNIAHVRECRELGAIGLKLHNAPLIDGSIERNVVHSDAWQEIFALAGSLNMPIIWHVSQRKNASKYTGGKEHSYWSEAFKKGLTFTNEDLLQDFLSVVDSHPNTTFIGAHQLHLGPDRLGELFHSHPNLVTDTSIGCFVAYGDRMYDKDRLRWRRFALEFADRLLFGTDVMIDRKTARSEMLKQHFLGHLRWVRQLQLPQEALSKIAHGNFERIAGLDPVPMLPWWSLRP